MKKRFRVMALLTCIAVFWMQSPVQAADLSDLGTVVDGSLLTDAPEAVADSRDVLRGNYLSYGTTSVVDHDDGTITAGGSTIAYVICDKVYLTVTLQQLVGDTWYDYRTWEVTKKNVSSLTKEYTLEVPSGYYYRAKGVHLVEKDGDNTESQVTTTDGIWID